MHFSTQKQTKGKISEKKMQAHLGACHFRLKSYPLGEESLLFFVNMNGIIFLVWTRECSLLSSGLQPGGMGLVLGVADLGLKQKWNPSCFTTDTSSGSS